MVLRNVKVSCFLLRGGSLKNGCRKITSLSYLHHIGKDPLRATTLGRLIEKCAIKYEDNVAVISRHQEKSLTFEEAHLQADKLAAGLKAIGMKPGKPIGVWSPNCLEWYIAMLACARGGFLMASLDPSYQETEIEYTINKLQMQTLICLDKSKKNNYWELINKLAPNVAECEPGNLKAPRLSSLRNIVTISDTFYKGTYNFQEVLHKGDEDGVKQIRRHCANIQSDDPFFVHFTSGTTGKPKAALSSHFNLVNNAYEIAKRNELNQKHHTICVQVPFFHVFGTVATIVAGLHFGSTLVLPDLTYNPDASLTAIKENKCTVIHGTPTMYVDLIGVQKKRQEDISPEIAVSGGAPCSPQLFRQMLDILGVKKVKSVYGLTETTTVVFQSLYDEDATKATSTVGHVGDHIEVKIIDENGKVVPRGTPGELCVRSYANMLGYYGDEERTKEVLSVDRWLKTGDQFILYEDGYGKIVGRLKDMINRGGENVFPKEVEDFLNTHPDVLESQVVGLPDERLGEIVCACIRLKSGRSMELKDVQDYCKNKIADYKIPVVLHIFDEFPKTTSGKIQKYRIVQKIKELMR